MNNTAIISHCNTEKRYCKLNKLNAPSMLRQPIFFIINVDVRRGLRLCIRLRTRGEVSKMAKNLRTSFMEDEQ